MANNKREIIRKVNDAFASGDTDTILSYLTDDVRWDINGNLAAVGKEEFRKEINNEAFEGLPVITTLTEVEDEEHVAVEGTVQCRRKDGGILDAYFFDIYRLENGKIKEMRSYVVEKTPADKPNSQ